MKTCPNCQRTYPDDFSLCPQDGAQLTAQATETEAQLAAGLSRRFRLVRRLGKGGMGTVFLAEQIGVGNRPVALKVLNRKLLDDPDFLLRFQNEAGSTGRIHHPNVVTIFESAQGDDGTPYIAMEFLDGESLRDVLKQRGALPLPEVVEILQQTARGLNAAHKLGIIHRDLKPDNLFLTHGDEGELVVKVVDFGIAKLRESSMHTQTGTVLGTPAYMSSEQAYGMRSDELDARSDVYSLGVVVYEMLTGRLPFHSDTPAGFLRKHLMEEPPPFRAVAQGLSVPPAVESAVMKALVKDRNQRYTSALNFAHELTSAAQPSPPAEAPVALPSTLIVSPPTLEVSQPIPSTKVVQPPKQIPPESKPGVRVNPKDGLKYVWIPPGTFMMGCSAGDTECDDKEKPPHQVAITKGFWLGQTEVTMGAYKRFAAATGKGLPPVLHFNDPVWSNDQMPIVNVSWDDAQAYCAWAGGRLPTEAEWEYAARGGSTAARYGSIDAVARYSDNSSDETHEVGQKRANGFGLYDMLGNVWEWVNDWYDEKYYHRSPPVDPAGPAGGESRVLRGGSWGVGPDAVRVSCRNGNYPSRRVNDLGFRCGGEVFAP
jgi:formylglycine-generating enzyme required for sulfatase activity/predicted Ser/Thr protein kinase